MIKPPENLSTCLCISDDETYQELNYVDVLHLATRGGASLLDMQDTLGALDPGKNADILVVDLAGKGPKGCPFSTIQVGGRKKHTYVKMVNSPYNVKLVTKAHNHAS